MEAIANFFSHFVQPDPGTAMMVVFNLIIIESLLSVDNAAVLATIVLGLPREQRRRALRIGIIFAYVFRGAALIFASLLIKISWLKLAGGGYLLFLCAEFFYDKITSGGGEEETKTRKPWKIPGLTIFWSTVLMVELVDVTFSIDNVFAAVAFTKNIYLVCTGVFIGIITMRIVAGYFVQLMQKFPFLDTVAFIVIGILGLRLCADFCCSYITTNQVCILMHHEHSDLYFSLLTAGVFFIPVLSSLLLGFPKRKN